MFFEYEKFSCLVLSREFQALKSLELKFGFQNFQNFSTKRQLESFLMYYFVCLGFLKRLLIP